MRLFVRTFLTLAIILFLISTLYFFISGTSLFYGFVCLGCFLFSFVTAVQLTPPTQPKPILCAICRETLDIGHDHGGKQGG